MHAGTHVISTEAKHSGETLYFVSTLYFAFVPINRNVRVVAAIAA
jgi:hypothetical protein